MRLRERNLQDVAKKSAVRNDDPYRERSMRDADKKASFYAAREEWDKVVDASQQFLGHEI